MLVLSRRVGEEIVIGKNVRVKVVAAHGNKVRLAVSAPRAIRVDRSEINQRRAEFDFRDDEPEASFVSNLLAEQKQSGIA